ncbi:hypothetical protein M011DRAFT_180014 [Sporormia fimetaria CBS 119925]|uniref:Uncharacterized protein n=1 Tax=Sporormia fimetaria CBS 119925 TaxID=1340428 RepID=A0A6A6VJ86_9PLEO|nr:hypothetical protein M011DRAFT_180014 [Sporormia fimetaria CBS 119925]
MYIPSTASPRRALTNPPPTTLDDNYTPMADMLPPTHGKRKRLADADGGPENAYNLFEHSQAQVFGWETGVRKLPRASQGWIDPNSHSVYVQRPFKLLKRLSPAPLSRKPTPHTMHVEGCASPSPSCDMVLSSKPSSYAMTMDIDRAYFPSTCKGGVRLTQPCVGSAPAVPDLRACHICHNAPKFKTDLQNYLTCQSCDERACFICARECSAGCLAELCSRCCVEVGQEGDTHCLKCYQRDVNST